MDKPPPSHCSGRFVIQFPVGEQLRHHVLLTLPDLRRDIDILEHAFERGDVGRGTVILDEFADHVMLLHDKVNALSRR